MRELDPLVADLVAEITERKRRLAEEQGRQSSFSLGIVGLGSLGKIVAARVAKLEPIEGYLDIPRVVLYTRRTESAVALRDSLSPVHGREFVVAPALEELVAQTDIAIITAESDDAKAYRASLGRRRAPDRGELCAKNVGMIESLARAFRGYRGIVGIATNDPVVLAGFFCNAALLEPGQVFGITHVDSLRAMFVAADWIRRELGQQTDFKLEIFVAGGHGAGTMVPLLSQARFSGLSAAAVGLLHERLPSLKAEIEALGPKRYLALDNTSIDTSDAVIESIEAIISESKRVSAAIYCDFDSAYFKADPDFYAFNVQRKALWLGLPTRFKDLRAYPAIDFKELAIAEKEAFYGAARRYAEFAERLDRGKITMKQSEQSSAESKPELMLYVTAGRRLLELDSAGQECRSWQFDEALRRFGSTARDGKEHYVGFANGFWLIKKDMQVRYVIGNAQPGESYGINSVVRIGDRLFATHHNYGLLCSYGIRLESLVDCAARELLSLWNGVAFAASYGKENAVLHYDSAPRKLFLADSELVGLANCGELIVAASKAGSIYVLVPKGRELKVLAKRKLQDKLLSLAADNENIVLGGERAIYWTEPNLSTLHIVRIPRPVLDLTIAKRIVIATDGSALYNAFTGMRFADYKNISSICLSSKI